jgi:hypothetical protein
MNESFINEFTSRVRDALDDGKTVVAHVRFPDGEQRNISVVRVDGDLCCGFLMLRASDGYESQQRAFNIRQFSWVSFTFGDPASPNEPPKVQ